MWPSKIKVGQMSGTRSEEKQCLKVVHIFCDELLWEIGTINVFLSTKITCA
jgi:hypothetical protein